MLVNLLLNQTIYKNNGGFDIEEISPLFLDNENKIKFLTLNDTSILWSSIKGSKNITITQHHGDIKIDVSIYDPISESDIYVHEKRIGIGRKPLYNYILDIKVPENSRTTALHIGDGISGFSMGNATDSGFLPQIIGVGSDEDDAGFYILGKTIVDTNSNIPAIILDGRTIDNKPLQNRPILGISSGSYTDYKLVINADGNIGIGTKPGIYKLNVNGNIKVSNLICETSIGVINLINEIIELKARVKALE